MKAGRRSVQSPRNFLRLIPRWLILESGNGNMEKWNEDGSDLGVPPADAQNSRQRSWGSFLYNSPN